jgi:hypothetical protein
MHLLLGQEAAALSGDGPSPLHGEKLANTTTGPNGNDGSEMHLSCDRKVIILSKTTLPLNIFFCIAVEKSYSGDELRA